MSGLEKLGRADVLRNMSFFHQSWLQTLLRSCHTQDSDQSQSLIDDVHLSWADSSCKVGRYLQAKLRHRANDLTLDSGVDSPKFVLLCDRFKQRD